MDSNWFKKKVDYRQLLLLWLMPIILKLDVVCFSSLIKA